MSAREVGDTAGAARRMIRALGRRVGDEGDPIDLQLITDLRAEVEAALTTAMRAQHVGQGFAVGFSHAEIAQGLGVSRQAVTKRLAQGSTDVA